MSRCFPKGHNFASENESKFWQRTAAYELRFVFGQGLLILFCEGKLGAQSYTLLSWEKSQQWFQCVTP